MNRQIQDIMVASEGRYLTKTEQAVLREFMGRLDLRMAAMDEIQAKEEVIIDQTLWELLRAYPDYEQKHKGGRHKGVRDMTLVLRYATMAMVRGDSQYLDEALLIWLSTILKGIGFTIGFLEDAYRTLERVADRELTPQSAELLRPYLAQCTAALTGRKGS